MNLLTFSFIIDESQRKTFHFLREILLNFSGSIDKEEIIESFKRLGVAIDPNEADKLLSK